MLAVVKTTVFLADMNDYPDVNKAYAECKLLHTRTVPPPPVANTLLNALFWALLQSFQWTPLPAVLCRLLGYRRTPKWRLRPLLLLRTLVLICNLLSAISYRGVKVM